MAEETTKVRLEYDKHTDVMFFDFGETANPIDTVRVAEDIVVHVDMKTQEIIGVQITNWRPFRNRLFRRELAFSPRVIFEKTVRPQIAMLQSWSQYCRRLNPAH